MKNKTRLHSTKRLNTTYVFSKNNQVYIKKNADHSFNESKDPDMTEISEEWFPINFQWKSLIELRKNMEIQ